MKKIINRRTYIFLFSFMMLSLTKVISFAQDSAAASGSSTQTTTTTTEHASTVPAWVWIVGGVILLSIIIGLLSRKKGGEASRTDKVTYTKTTSTDTNT